MHSEQIKKVIHDTVMAFYKPPPKFKRGEVGADEDEPVLRDIVSEKGPGGKKGLNKS